MGLEKELGNDQTHKALQAVQNSLFLSKGQHSLKYFY